MVVICPRCNRPIPCDDDASCVETVPPHLACPGSGDVGFVLPSSTEETERDEECVRQIIKKRKAA